MGKGTKTVTSTTAPNPEAMKAYLNVINRAQSTANTPYERYSGQLVAGFNPMQQQGFDAITNYAGTAGTESLPDIISRYYSPYTDEVVNKTMDNIRINDAQQQERLKSDAIAQGAFGGNRQSLVMNDLIRNQNLASGQTIAGLRNQGYQNAATNALNDQQRLNQEKLAGIAALTAGGQQRQQNTQAQLDSDYNLWKEGKEYPFKTDQWLAGIVGSTAPGMGGTNTQQIPQPSLLQQLAGAGMTGLGLYNAGAFKGLGSMFGKGSGMGGLAGSMAGFADGGAVKERSPSPNEAMSRLMPLFHQIKGGLVPGFATGGTPTLREDVSFFGVPPSGVLPEVDAPSIAAPVAGMLPLPAPRTAAIPNNAVPTAAPNAPTEDLTAGFSMEGGGGEALDNEAQFSPWMALAAAGLGTLASKSPYAGQAIGEGGLSGLNFFGQQQKAKKDQISSRLRSQQIEQQARRLDMQAQQAERRLQNQDKLLEIQKEREERMAGREEWQTVGPTEDGAGLVQMNKRTGEYRVQMPKDEKGNQIKLKPKTSELTAADRKLIADGEDKVINLQSVINNLGEALSLNDKAYSGPLAKQRGYVTSMVGEEGGLNTEKIENLVTSQALSQLKATFGAAPTEGERKILLEIQGSTNKAPEVRADIWNRAKLLAEKRLQHEQDKINQIRGGTYYKPQDQKGKNAAPPELLKQAKDAINSGAPRDQVINRLKEQGYDASGL